MKKNNKGFSLVELIVVVLIMGILAVALAPQVMKWVSRAQKSGNRNTSESVKSALQVAVADFLADGGKIPDSGFEFNWESGKIPKGTAATVSTKVGDGTFAAYVEEVTGGDYNAEISGKIKINAAGVVEMP